jgi:hypothetical protein
MSRLTNEQATDTLSTHALDDPYTLPVADTHATVARPSPGLRALVALGGLTITATSLAPWSSGPKALGIFAGLLLALPGAIRMMMRRRSHPS